ncbi:ABC transporter ATP-binding protein [Waddlia chondrophila]|uniref:Spermidine/putrescine import ATP-binding protein PotA n=1 Tax=Waddlia chondrophila (strain ATCC VR-1470 / WSU 86-1044) TaxID=716544 RepID=D6YVX4_WADCW|nr:ABC transporter ATP-binding protein [Waddlia chondrophila]ADI38285.1 spermidine/putrescine transport system ATP- binding protein [Waddlia chondrophila WSU 86-1044]
MKNEVVFNHISKHFNQMEALSNVSFSIENGEFFSILGPSGCGKTTLLRLLAGFEKPDQGSILLNSQEITNLPTNKRPVNTVFQNYALFPHLTIKENIAFGLRIKKIPEKQIDKEVDQMLDLIQMTSHVNKFPHQISGGQKQRVAIARALINKPKVLLLDEPLAALDLKLRQKMLIDLDLIHDEVGITFIFVTHDQEEAMAVSDRIAILNNGKLEQIGTPSEIYETPKSRFVARFIGDTNFFDGIVEKVESKEYSLLHFDDFPPVKCYHDLPLNMGDLVHLSVRPEKIQVSKEKPPATPLYNCMKGKIGDKVYKGDHTHFGVLIGNRKISVTKQHDRFLLDQVQLNWEDDVWISWHANDGFIFAREKYG